MTQPGPARTQPTPTAASPEEPPEKRRRRLLLLLLLPLIPACLWIVSQLALIGLGANRVNESAISGMAASYLQWQAQSFAPVNPELIGTIRADQATLAAGPGAVPGGLVPFIPLDALPGVTIIAGLPSPTPTATPTATPTSPPAPTATYTSVVIIPPVWTNTPIPTSTATLPPPLTPVPPTPVPPTPTTGPPTDLEMVYKDDFTAAATPGLTTTYTILVRNNGPNAVVGALVTDNFPSATNVIWTCSAVLGSCGAGSGAGNLNVTVDLLATGTATISAAVTIDPAATGFLTNTATVTPPLGVTDLNPGNNSASDTDMLNPSADLAITKIDSRGGSWVGPVSKAWPGGALTYTITVTNAGPSNAVGATVADAFPASLGVPTWTCAAVGVGASCTAGGSGNINDTVNVPVGGSVTYTVNTILNPAASGTLDNTATVSSVIDPAPGNNTAFDSDAIGPPIIQILLDWTSVSTAADLDLWVYEPPLPPVPPPPPPSNLIYWNQYRGSPPPITWSPGGGQLDEDTNCVGFVLPVDPRNPEITSWATGGPLGAYTVEVHFFDTCPIGTPWAGDVTWTLTVIVDTTTIYTTNQIMTGAPAPGAIIFTYPFTLP